MITMGAQAQQASASAEITGFNITVTGGSVTFTDLLITIPSGTLTTLPALNGSAALLSVSVPGNWFADSILSDYLLGSNNAQTPLHFELSAGATLDISASYQLSASAPANIQPGSTAVANASIMLFDGNDNQTDIAFAPSATADDSSIPLSTTMSSNGTLHLTLVNAAASPLMAGFDAKLNVAGNDANIAAAVPEPATYGMMALGLVAVGALGRRRARG